MNRSVNQLSVGPLVPEIADTARVLFGEITPDNVSATTGVVIASRDTQFKALKLKQKNFAAIAGLVKADQHHQDQEEYRSEQLVVLHVHPLLDYKLSSLPIQR